MIRWFRIYDDVINDPKVLGLTDAMRWAWLAILCVASKNEGILPSIDHVALMLRVNKQRASVVIATLHKAGLLDKTETGYRPHNWDKRQFKSDVSTGRVKRFRNNKRNANDTVSETPPESESESEDRIGDARARGPTGFTTGSKALASALWKALGFDHPLAIPPEFAGVDWRAIEWERAGWTVDLIDVEARRIARDKPLKPLSYFEKVFATSFAKRQAPLPVVEIREAEKLTVIHGKTQSRSGSLIDTINRELADLEDAEDDDPALPKGPVLRLSN